jgi:hypothetical protein
VDISSYRCPKCHHHKHTVDEIRTTGGFLSKLFDVQNKRFTSVTCDRCTYTEFFRTKQSTLGSVFDLFTGG